MVLGLPALASASTVDSGIIDGSDNLHWSIDSDGVVTFAGEGSMGDYTWTPWEDAGIPIKKVIIQEGVTTVARSTFSGQDTLETVELPSTLVSIGKYAFSQCSSLKEITIPESVTLIDSYAFERCKSLEKVVIPKSVQELGDFAFYCCFSLKTVIFYADIHMDSSGFFGSCHEDVTFYAFKDGNIKDYCESFDYNYFNPEKLSKVKRFYVGSDLKTTSATLTWDKVNYADGYKLYKYNANTKKYALVKTLDPAITSYKITGLKSGTCYRYRIKAYMDFEGKTYTSSNSNLKFRTLTSSASIKPRNAKIDKGYRASVKTVTKKYSELYGFTKTDYNRYWTGLSGISQFQDNKGNFCVAYMNKKCTHVYIRAYNKDLKQVYYRKIKKLYPTVGTVTCDDSGNFYIVWGKADSDDKTGTVTMAVSKYKKNGTLVKTYKHKTTVTGSARIPFNAGNCDVTFVGDVLVCNYALERYDGHQSNGVLSVNTKNMTLNTDYENYVSHAFDQRVLTDKDNVVWFANHGDCSPRGFNVAGDTEYTYKPEALNFTPFHFYAPASAHDDMQVLNRTNASLGGIVETSSGLMLIGSSVKSLKASGYNTQAQNLFIMYAEPDRKIEDGVSRSGICLGENVTDKSVKWLTSYSKYDVENPQVVYTDDDRIIVLWEKVKPAGINPAWKGTYYMVLSANGKVLQKATQIKGVRLHANEEPIYKDGYVYWSTCGKEYVEDNKLRLHRLKVGTLVKGKK